MLFADTESNNFLCRWRRHFFQATWRCLYATTEFAILRSKTESELNISDLRRSGRGAKLVGADTEPKK